jgi:hypothetical protein
MAWKEAIIKSMRLLASGRSSAEVSKITGYSLSWIYELVWGYNSIGAESLGDKRHEQQAEEKRF